MEYFKNFNSKDAQDVGFEQLAEMIRSDEELRKNTQLYRDLMAQVGISRVWHPYQIEEL